MARRKRIAALPKSAVVCIRARSFSSRCILQPRRYEEGIQGCFAAQNSCFLFVRIIRGAAPEIEPTHRPGHPRGAIVGKIPVVPERVRVV